MRPRRCRGRPVLRARYDAPSGIRSRPPSDLHEQIAAQEQAEAGAVRSGISASDSSSSASASSSPAADGRARLESSRRDLRPRATGSSRALRTARSTSIPSGSFAMQQCHAQLAADREPLAFGRRLAQRPSQVADRASGAPRPAPRRGCRAQLLDRPRVAARLGEQQMGGDRVSGGAGLAEQAAARAWIGGAARPRHLAEHGRPGPGVDEGDGPRVGEQPGDDEALAGLGDRLGRTGRLSAAIRRASAFGSSTATARATSSRAALRAASRRARIEREAPAARSLARRSASPRSPSISARRQAPAAARPAERVAGGGVAAGRGEALAGTRRRSPPVDQRRGGLGRERRRLDRQRARLRRSSSSSALVRAGLAGPHGQRQGRGQPSRRRPI